MPDHIALEMGGTRVALLLLPPQVAEWPRLWIILIRWIVDGETPSSGATGLRCHRRQV